MDRELVYYVSGGVAGGYFAVTFLCGILVIMKNKTRFGELGNKVPYAIFAMHLIAMGFLLGACFSLNDYVFIGFGIACLVKIIWSFSTVYEIRALSNIRDVQQLD